MKRNISKINSESLDFIKSIAKDASLNYLNLTKKYKNIPEELLSIII